MSSPRRGCSTKPQLGHQRFELGIAARCAPPLQSGPALVHDAIGIAAQAKSRQHPCSVAATKIDPNEHSPMAKPNLDPPPTPVRRRLCNRPAEVMPNTCERRG